MTTTTTPAAAMKEWTAPDGEWRKVPRPRAESFAAVTRRRGWRVLVDSRAWFIAAEPGTQRYMHIDRGRVDGYCDMMIGY